LRVKRSEVIMANTKNFITKNTDIKTFCVCCGNTNQKEFYSSINESHKATRGKLPWCKNCVSEQYDKFLKRYGSGKLAIYFLCKKFDIYFSVSAYEGAENHAIKTGWTIVQSYFKLINSFRDKNGYGTCFEESLDCLDNFNTSFENEDSESIDEDLQIFWGKGFSTEDLIFLESELSSWKQTHKCDNQAEVTLLKEICIKILSIRNKRATNENTSNDLKELQDLMKTASVDPAKANAASAGKQLDCFGSWIKDIEQFKPAEWYKQQEKYKDMDGFEKYINNYIKRPIENFLTGVRNFFVDDNIDANLEEGD
jgi:hypothetical protein